MRNLPRSAADPRPDSRPYFIAPNCPTCEAALVLVDRNQPAPEVWHDEWECPRCDDGIYLDWPESAIEALKAAGLQERHVPIEQLVHKCQSNDDPLG